MKNILLILFLFSPFPAIAGNILPLDEASVECSDYVVRMSIMALYAKQEGIPLDINGTNETLKTALSKLKNAIFEDNQEKTQKAMGEVYSTCINILTKQGI